jgi:predicted amidophosphoribosyltransferase
MSRRITLSDVELARAASPKRARFVDHPVIYKPKPNSPEYVASLKFPCVDRLFVAETGLVTKEGPYGPYLFLSRPEDIERALEWQERRGKLIFLRDNLDFSIALDFNLAEAGRYTKLGQAEHDAKNNQDKDAVDALAAACSAAIKGIPVLDSHGLVCAVPPSAGKKWDLPTEIASRVASSLGRTDVTKHLNFASTKESIKGMPLKQKWGALEKGKLQVGKAVNGRHVLLVDDKYQSGTTMQFVASKLLEAGAVRVSGVCCVKTWRDTDNT